MFNFKIQFKFVTVLTLLILMNLYVVSSANSQNNEKYTVQYRQMKEVDPNLLSLDIYTNPGASDQPVMIFTHGGSWQGGDKQWTGEYMVDGFLNRGYLFISTNYRMYPDYQFPAHTQDLAAAISWVYKNIVDYGGNPYQIFLSGHSAGAHLVAHVATDERYLKEYGLTLNIIKGVIPLDVTYYNIPLMASMFGGYLPGASDVFTQDPEFWKFASPITYVEPSKNIPPMIVAFSNAQEDPIFTEDFVDKLNYEGNMSAVLAAPLKNHFTIAADFGYEYDPVTIESISFIEKASDFTRLTFEKDYEPGTYDENQNFMGGTELMLLEAHKGKLFAGISYKGDRSGNAPLPGQQVLVKESNDVVWKEDAVIGNQGKGSITCLNSITFTKDKEGYLLRNPVTILLASPEDGTSDVRVYSRDDVHGVWTEMVIASNIAGSNKAHVNVIIDHTDSVTGIQHVFAGSASSALYRGAYDSEAPGRISWETEPELVCTESMDSAAVANGILYLTAGSNGNPDDNDGGLFMRIDGSEPSWEMIYEWEKSEAEYSGLHGLTSVSDLDGEGYEILIGAIDNKGSIVQIDPTNEHEVTTEFEYKNYFEEIWGGLGDDKAIAAYNNMTTVVDQALDKEYRLIGLRVSHPEWFNAPYNGSYYLVRHQDGAYEWGNINEPGGIRSGSGLSACRTIAVSPFAEDRGKVLYFGGFDTGDENYHNTAWIYRGEISPNECEPSPFATVDITSWGEEFKEGDILEVSAKVENFSMMDLDVYAAIAINGKFYWYPAWDKNPHPGSVQNYTIWKETIISMTITKEIRNTIGNFSLRAAITERGNFDIIDFDSIEITFE